MAGGRGDGDAVALAPGVFLHHHQIGALGHRRPGEDPRRGAGGERGGEGAPGGGLAHYRQRAGQVGGAQGIAVHRGGIERRLGDPRHRVRKEHPACGVAQVHVLALRCGRKAQHQRQRVLDRQQAHGAAPGPVSGARKLPDLPPVFESSRTPSIRMSFCAALSMS